MGSIAEHENGENAPRRRSAELRSRLRLKEMGQWTVGKVGTGLSRILGSRAGDAWGILTYHRVTLKPTRGPAPTWNVPPARFREQLAGLLQRGYQAWPLRKILAFSAAGQPIPPRIFIVTLDDGYENNYLHAWPVLRELGVPATLFLATAYLDGTAAFPFDDWSSAGTDEVPAESWRPLTTAQCAEMLGHGLIELGSHTHTHARFHGRTEALAEDIAASLDVLASRFDVRDATFSFPYGITGPDLAAAARRAGVLCGLTTQAMLVRPGSDPFTWGRFNVEESDTAATLAAKLDGWYSLARRAWLRLRGPVSAGAEYAGDNPACLLAEGL